MALERYASTADNLKTRAAYRTALSAIVSRGNDETFADLGELMHRRRQRSHAKAKLARRAVYLTVTAYGIPARAVARALGLDIKEVRYALRSIEEARDDASFDRLLDELELEIMA